LEISLRLRNDKYRWRLKYNQVIFSLHAAYRSYLIMRPVYARKYRPSYIHFTRICSHE
jgi:hypothetical protein